MKVSSHKTMHEARLRLDSYPLNTRLFVAVAPPNALGSLLHGLKEMVGDFLNRGEIRRQKLEANLDLAAHSANRDILWKLASHADPEVRGAVAENHHEPHRHRDEREFHRDVRTRPEELQQDQRTESRHKFKLCARPDSNRRPLGSKPSALIR